MYCGCGTLYRSADRSDRHGTAAYILNKPRIIGILRGEIRKTNSFLAPGPRNGRENDMRLFLSINLSEEMKDALISVQNTMYDRGVRGNYTSEENMHLTVAFIGEYPDPERVLDALSCVSFSPFEITLEGVGCFGDLWWSGLRDSAALSSVVRRVRRSLAENAIPFDRKRFSAHITLLRKASGKMPSLSVRPVSMDVGAVSLLRSDRGRNGMIYTELGAIEAHR